MTVFLIQPHRLSHSVFMDGACWMCFVLPVFIRLGHKCQDLFGRCDGKHVCKDQTSVCTLIQKSTWGIVKGLDCSGIAKISVVCVSKGKQKVEELQHEDNNNNNSNRIQRCNLRFFTISSLRRKPSPTRTLK